jgi:adenylate cyclase
VRKAGSRVRITAQLIDAANDAQVWGERYDRDLNDIFAVQDEISKAIVSALRLTLMPEEKLALEKRSTTNAEAYKLYLMARQFWLLDNERNNEIVIRICQHVVELDPDYAQARATMALAQWNLFWRADLAHTDLAHPASRALALGPHLPDSHAAVAAAHRSKGEFKEGLEAAKKAVALDARSYVANRVAGLCCMGLRQFDEAIRYFDVAVEVMETDFTAAVFIVQCYQAKRDEVRTREAARKALSRIEKVVSDEPGHSRAIGLGVYILAILGERERAVEWATRARLIDPAQGTRRRSVLRSGDEAAADVQGIRRRGARGAGLEVLTRTVWPRPMSSWIVGCVRPWS